MTFTLAIGALWEWMGAMGRETLGVSPCPAEATQHRSVRTKQTSRGAWVTPSFLSQASICTGLEKVGGESTLSSHHKTMSCLTTSPAKSTARKEDAGAAHDKAVQQPCQRCSRAARPLSTLSSGGSPWVWPARRRTGALGSRG